MYLFLIFLCQHKEQNLSLDALKCQVKHEKLLCEIYSQYLFCFDAKYLLECSYISQQKSDV